MNTHKIHVLYIAHERKLGGASQSLVALVEEMLRRDYEVTVITPTSRCPVARKMQKMGVKIIPVFFAWWQMPSDWNFVFKILFRCLYTLENIQVKVVCYKLKQKNIQIDVVHTNSSVTDFGYKVAKQIGCCHVWHFREYGDIDYNLEYMRDKGKIFAIINQYSDRILFISKDLFEYYKVYMDESKCQVIYNGIPNTYLWERKYCNKDKIVFLIAGNLHRNKQQIKVLEAACELNRRKKDNYEIWIAGAASSMTDSQNYKRELEQFICEHHLKNIKMLGRIENMVELRSKADVEIVASKREAFGRVTIEAMYSGMPVIGTAAGANRELIKDGETGLLYENVKQLADKMEVFMEENGELQRMGENAYKYASSIFTAQRNADEIAQVYEACIKRNHAV